MANKDLEQVLTDWLGHAAVLKFRGHLSEAKLLETCAEEVKASAEDYLRFLSESDAQLRSGRSKDWLRSHYPEWETQKNAKKVNGRRLYRQIIIPRRANLSAAREDGRRTAVKRAS